MRTPQWIFFDFADKRCKKCYDFCVKLNDAIFAEVAGAGAQILVVSKYLPASQTQDLLAELGKYDCICGYGENRIEAIESKKISRKLCHFLGNIQSRNIKDIAQHCSVVHSLDSLKHAEKFSEVEDPPKVFLQINVSNEPQKRGILPESFTDFLQKMPTKLSVVGISALGAKEISEQGKREEFRLLKEIREKHNPDWLISAGTSADYGIALEEGIDIIRVGRALFPDKN